MDATKLTAQEQEQEKAKFSFSGATLYGINAVIGSGIFLQDFLQHVSSCRMII